MSRAHWLDQGWQGTYLDEDGDSEGIRHGDTIADLIDDLPDGWTVIVNRVWTPRGSGTSRRAYHATYKRDGAKVHRSKEAV